MKRYSRLCCAAAVAAVVLLSSCGGARRVEPVGEEPAPEPVPSDVGIVTEELLSPRVRVLILEAKSSVRVRVPNGFFLSEALDAAPLKRFERGGDFTVSASSERVKILDGRSKLHEAAVLVVMPATESNMYINGKPYRGGVIFRPVHGKVITINYIDIEDYIKGVLPVEIGYLKADELEAYRVQAVASRSYALSKLEEKKSEYYDLQATIMDQVYRGVQGENPTASEAVDETAGVVGLWNGQLIRAYYSSCCGGHTADIRVGWPWKDPYPYLYGNRDSSEERPDQSFCRRSSSFRWRVYGPSGYDVYHRSNYGWNLRGWAARDHGYNYYWNRCQWTRPGRIDG